MGLLSPLSHLEWDLSTLPRPLFHNSKIASLSTATDNPGRLTHVWEGRPLVSYCTRQVPGPPRGTKEGPLLWVTFGTSSGRTNTPKTYRPHGGEWGVRDRLVDQRSGLLSPSRLFQCRSGPLRPSESRDLAYSAPKDRGWVRALTHGSVLRTPTLTGPLSVHEWDNH